MKHVLMLLPLCVLACGPSVTTLVAEKRWDESVCAIGNEREAELAIPAIVEATHARFVVHEIVRSDLGSIDDATIGDFFTRYAVYAVDTRVDPTSTTSQTITASIEDGKKVHTATDFSVYMGETIPEPHLEKQTVLTDAAASKAFLAFISVGLSLIVDDRPMTKLVDVWVPPTLEQIEKSAPRASKLAPSFAVVYAAAPHFVVSRSEQASVRIVVDANAGTSCSAQGTYHARLDTLKIDEWKYVQDTKWVGLHTTGNHVVNVER